MASMDDESTLDDPGEALRLIEHEQVNVIRHVTPDPRLMYWPWGLTWLISFGLSFLRYGPDGRALVALPEWVPLTSLTALMIAAGIFTGVAGARSGRHISGPSSRQGVMYGISWSAGFSGLAILFGRVSDSIPDSLQALLWGGGMVTLVGALYMAGGAIWSAWDMFVLGAWISVVNAAGVLWGPGWHALVVSVAGGGGLLAAGLIGWMRRR
ncbi:transporter [Actinoplanes sp. NEAU-A12]|uniref:Transporter n=1 Tax=Actinoplanes sandaracinus TaxID=3045177 RepID=A0ABT6WLQ5_9ACTN|nr:transporter [Actinoplanes sandaracinus]MDI6100645.1 transporter [Actinoplanes sandaracinus]